MEVYQLICPGIFNAGCKFSPGNYLFLASGSWFFKCCIFCAGKGYWFMLDFSDCF